MMNHTPLRILQPAALALSLATLFPAPATAANEPGITRRLQFIIAGTRPEVTFEKRGDLYIEVDAPAHTIPPSQIEILGNKQQAESGDAIIGSLPAGLNEVVQFDGYKGERMLRLGLKRGGIGNGADAGTEVTCDLGESPAPLLVIFPENPSRGWENPVVRVLDISPASLSADAVLCINLSSANLGVRIGTTSAPVAAGRSKVFGLSPESATTFPFKVDLPMDQGSVPLANSSYRKSGGNALVLLAFPLARPGPGNPPVSLQFLTLPPVAAPQTQRP